MNLHDLQENKFEKLTRALKEMFDLDIDYTASVDKLVKIQEATSSQITRLRESGVDTTHKDYQKLLLISESLRLAIAENGAETVEVTESADLDQAEVLLAAKQLADDLQKMAENLASMQVEDLMSITNAMKEEVGTAEAEAFNSAAEAAISGALEAVKAANEGVSNAVLAAQGQPVSDMDMDAGDDMDVDVGGDMDVDVDMAEPEVDDFEGADAADADFGDEGREMKEDAYLAALRMIKEAQADGQVSKDVLKAAFAKIKG